MPKKKYDLPKGFTVQGKNLKYQKTCKVAGESKLIAVYGKDTDECYKKMESEQKMWETSVVQGTNLKTGHVKLYDGMKMYFNSQNELKDNSLLRKKTTLNNQIKKSKLSNKFADRTSTEEIQKLINDLATDGYSKSTVKHTLEAFTEYYNYLYGKYSHLNPTANLKLPHFEAEIEDIVEEKDILTDEEMKKFIVKCQEPASPHHNGCHYSDMFIVLMLTYMRAGEACGLQVRDFRSNPDGTGYIKINRTVTKKYTDADKEQTTYTTGSPKTKHSRREIKVSKFVADIIRARIEGKKKTDYVWTQLNKPEFLKPANVSNGFKRIFRQFAEENGIDKDLHLHCMRHTGISFALRHHYDMLIEISRMAGHKNVSVTLDIYQKVLRSSMDNAADAISASQDELLMNKAPKKKAA